MLCSCCDNKIWIEPTFKQDVVQIISKKGPCVGVEIGIEMSHEDALQFAQDIISAVGSQKETPPFNIGDTVMPTEECNDPELSYAYRLYTVMCYHSPQKGYMTVLCISTRKLLPMRAVNHFRLVTEEEC
jgi:hypothetical protein